ncbi:MAG TPA: glutathione S-transferase C-terminal domain-containing protein [Pyrinomonadaceae bacterium]
MTDPTLITFPPSLDSELARFLLTHYRIPHREQRHVIIFSSFATLWHGYTVRFPLFYDDSLRLNTVRKIIDHFDPLSTPERRLMPASDDPKSIEADWTFFNNTLGSATSVFGYYHLLPHRAVMIRPLSEGAPPFEVKAVRLAYPVFAGLLRLLLRLTAEHAQEALAQIKKVMEEVDKRLAAGGPYLMGEHFSLSDMAFAVAAAPVVWPDEYGGALPAFAETPPQMQAAITEMREHPSGQLALRIYRERRTLGH